jgi:hypothetical protein
MRPKPSTRASALSIKDKRAIMKAETEKVGKSTMPSALIDRLSTAVEENMSRQRKLLKTYNKSFENGLMEMPLINFQNWFFGL